MIELILDRFKKNDYDKKYALHSQMKALLQKIYYFTS